MQFSKKNEQKKLFTVSTPGNQKSLESIEKSKELIQQKTSYQIQLHLDEVNKRGLELKVWINTYQISDLEDFSNRNEFFEASKFWNKMTWKKWCWESI